MKENDFFEIGHIKLQNSIFIRMKNNENRNEKQRSKKLPQSETVIIDYFRFTMR